jgi:hypothetical protein
MERLRRQTIALTEHLALHSRKEDELITPLVEEHFSPPEQASMLQEILAAIPRAEMSTGVPWIVSRQEPDDREAYVRGLMAAMPAPAFEAAKGWIRDGIPADQWADLTSRIEGLA